MTITTAVAHIITSDAFDALRDPEIVILTEADEAGAAEEIGRIALDPEFGVEGAVLSLPYSGLAVAGRATEVEPGYWTVPVRPESFWDQIGGVESGDPR